MTTRTMLDTATCPSQSVIDLGVEQGNAFAVYMGGKGSVDAQSYSPDSAKEMWSGFLPVYCPVQDATANAITDANEAVQIADTYDADAFAVDLEEPTVEADPQFWRDYMDAFVPICHASGKRVAVYSSEATILEFSSCTTPPDCAWVGKWIGGAPMQGLDPHKIPGLANALWMYPGQRGWQYAHGYTFEGITFDVSVIDSEILTFPKPPADSNIPPVAAPVAPVVTTVATPVDAELGETPLTTAYTVKSGDSLWSLAEQFNTTVEELYEANKDVIEAAATHNGYADSRNGALIWPGEVFKV